MNGVCQSMSDARSRQKPSRSASDRAFAYWDPADEHWARTAAQRSSGFVPAGPNALHREAPGWYVDAGTYRLHIGRSSADLAHCSEIVVEDGGTAP